MPHNHIFVAIFAILCRLPWWKMYIFQQGTYNDNNRSEAILRSLPAGPSINDSILIFAAQIRKNHVYASCQGQRGGGMHWGCKCILARDESTRVPSAQRSAPANKGGNRLKRKGNHYLMP